MNPIKEERFWEYDHLLALGFEKFIYEFWNNVIGHRFDDNTRDQFNVWKSRYLTSIRNISKQERIEIGHQAKDFILSAYFAGIFSLLTVTMKP